MSIPKNDGWYLAKSPGDVTEYKIAELVTRFHRMFGTSLASLYKKWDFFPIKPPPGDGKEYASMLSRSARKSPRPKPRALVPRGVESHLRPDSETEHR